MALGQDLRYGLRMLQRAPGFAAIAILTLGLGIGANTAIFSIVAPVLFEPLPFPHPDRIIEVAHVNHGEVQNGLTGAEALAILARQQTLSSAAIVDQVKATNLAGVGAPQRIHTVRVTGGFFRVWGIEPNLGRDFTASDDAHGAPRTAILSYGLWQSEFGGEANVLGRQLRLDGDSYTVIGVMPPNFVSLTQNQLDPAPVQLWIDMQPVEADLELLGPNLDFLGRLRPGVSLANAQSDLDREKAIFNHQNPNVAAKMGWGALDYRTETLGDSQQPLYLLLGTVGLVLLIACANLANLLLARGTGRIRELAIRAAVGADAGRIRRQLLTESLLLAALGALAGWLLAWWSVPLLQQATPRDFSLPLQGGLDWRVLLFTAALAILTGIVFGLAPALRAGKVDLNLSLKESAPSTGGRGRGRGVLVAGEVALAFLLLCGASLLAASLLQLQRVNPGFDTHNLWTAQTTLSGSRLTSDAAATQFSDAIVAQLERTPGIEAAASITGLPLTRAMNYPVIVTGHKEDPHSDDVEWRAVSPDFFRALGVRMTQGRGFTADDTATSLRVAIISNRFAQYYWPHASALGHTIGVPDLSAHHAPPTVYEIVGVAADIHENGVDRRPPFALFVPQAQAGDSINQLVNHWFSLGFVVRGHGADTSRALRAAFAAVDADQPVAAVQPLDNILGASLGSYRFLGTVLGIFAALALALGAIGIYGVLSYAVAQRRREIGVRLALGAGRSRILGQFVGEALRWAALGLAAGLAGAWGLTRLLADFLFGVTPTDPTVWALTAGTLLAVAALAALQPAWRATRTDPLTALRLE